MAKASATCPICDKPLSQASETSAKPFCSKRCKDVDLNRWLSGGYFIPGNQAGDDSEAVPEGSPSASSSGDATTFPDETKH